MKNENLIQHLASVDLSFLKVVKDEVIEAQNILKLQEEKVFFEILPPPENWSNEITELETFFTSIEIPPPPIEFNNYTIIRDVKKFIENHLSIVKTNNGKRAFLPYLDRLQALQKIIVDKNN